MDSSIVYHSFAAIRDLCKFWSKYATFLNQREADENANICVVCDWKSLEFLQADHRAQMATIEKRACVNSNEKINKTRHLCRTKHRAR